MFTPSEITFTLPSLRKVTIREQNGEDMEVLSKVKDGKTARNIDLFLARIIQDYNGQGKIKPDDAAAMFSADRYFILLKSRIQSLGPTLKFEQEWNASNTDGRVTVPYKQEYEEDLSQFVYDFDDPDAPEPNSRQVRKYPNEGKAIIEIEVEGKPSKFRWHILTGKGEKSILLSDVDNLTINDKLRARELAYHDEEKGEWIEMESFKQVPARLMTTFRESIRVNDQEFLMNMELTEPKSGHTVTVPLIGMPDFFFPERT